MTKPLGYYVDSSAALETLEAEFGPTLQGLDKSEKLHLLGILSMREQQVEDGSTASVYTVASAYQEHCFEGTAEVDRCCEILDLLPSRQTRGLILALANQIHQP